MSRDPFTIGDVLAFTAAFYAASGFDENLGTGTPVTPSSVLAAVRNPLGTVFYPTPSQLATGVYYAEYPLNLGGVWHYRMAATGGYQGAIEGAIPVPSSTFT